ncbi:MAG TPA: UDP-N-acetylglucosamine 2-epimerase (non-hydrolyzing) [Gemmatimonadales bacterium]|nr:UDP-N-acetylglucosamine 2-epimerase (non-hydrolyzing) [Gemmatimonadales bacterium]
MRFPQPSQPADPAGPLLLHVVGARPNFMKLAPVLLAGQAVPGLRQHVVHTGQHYDREMSDRFFEELGIPRPDQNLDVGSATHAQQTAAIMARIEPVLLKVRPDWVVVYGDVNSTMAAALVAVKLGIRVAHVEAGLRSRDRTMPEEINRLVTDQLADLLLTPSRDADANLRAEGIPEERIAFVGNVMVDTLLRLREQARALAVPERLGLNGSRYVFVTLHRPSNVDDPATLRELLTALESIAGRMPVVFAVHPRTRHRISEFGLEGVAASVRLLNPLGYLETVGLMERSALVLTDSGGLQEETTVLGVPCLTARPNTERPVTVTEGTNRLVASTTAAVLSAVNELLADQERGVFQARQPEYWDGRAGERVMEALLRW